MTYDKSTADLIFDMRRQAGVTQEELARGLGISQKTISALEKGSVKASFERMQQIAKFFGKEVNIE
jgi:DNA-binding XRE family transcriptional regulator